MSKVTLIHNMPRKIYLKIYWQTKQDKFSIFIFFPSAQVLPRTSHLRKISFQFDLVKYNCSQALICDQTVIFVKQKLLFNIIFIRTSFRICAAFCSVKLISKDFIPLGKKNVCWYSYFKIYTHAVTKTTAFLNTSLVYESLGTALLASFYFMMFSHVFIPLLVRDT